MSEVPYFLWSQGEEVSETELRESLRSADPSVRALWAGRVLREARFADVWRYLTLEQVLSEWDRINKHLGRRRPFWEWLLESWRSDGLLSS